MNSKALQRLIKVIQRQIEEELLQKTLLEKQVEDLEKAIGVIKMLLTAESDTLAKQPISYCDYYSFYSHHKNKRDELGTEVIFIKQTIEEKLESLRDLFIEKKRYELLLAKHMRAEQDVINKIENDAIDEIGIQGFRRKSE